MCDESTPTADVIFCDALERPQGERAAFVREACAGDEALAAEVHSLMAAHPEAEAFLDSPIALDALRSIADGGDGGADPLIGLTLGAYRIVQRIGAGGMGAVYEAERDDAEFEKRVAIKVIKRGMDTDDILHRFRTERQVLAKLEHPNVARLLDGGATPDGRPYLVMEFVEGERIDRYCDAKRLSIDRRLDLYTTLCEAVQFAHQNLVVHRDLKPGNVLVTAAGDLKLLDFGIAKMLTGGDAPGHEVTATKARQLTPAYASPEQLQGGPSTTATDVYSLGVILYELLSGRHPFFEKAETPIELERAVRETQPTAPSAIITHLAGDDESRGLLDDICAARSTDAARLSRRLRGDLENIILKCLRKEPERRYASAHGLAEEIRRHQTGLPVSARPDTFGYRASKFVQRNRTGVIAAALVVLSLVGGLAASVMMYVQAEGARQREASARVEAEQTSDFMRSLLASINPQVAQGRDVAVLRDVLDAAAGRLDAELGDYPAAAQMMHHTIGQTYDAIAEYDNAERHLLQAIDQADLLDDEPEVARAESSLALGIVYYNLGRYDEAESKLNDALGAFRLNSSKAASRVQSVRMLGHVARARSDYIEAQRLMEEAVTAARNDPAVPPLVLATALESLANVLADRELGEQAIEAIAESLAIREANQPGHHPQIGRAHHTMGWALRRNGQSQEAEDHYRRALEINRIVLPERHPNLATSLNHLAGALQDQGKLDEAEQLFREALAVFEHNHGEMHRDVGTANNNLGLLLTRMEQFDEAALHYEKAIEIYRNTIGADHVFVAIVLTNLISLFDEQGRLLEAADELIECRRLIGLHMEPSTRYPLFLRNIEAAMLMEQGELEQAEPELVRTYELLRGKVGAESSMTRSALKRLVRLYERWGRHAEAASYRAVLEGGDEH